MKKLYLGLLALFCGAVIASDEPSSADQPSSAVGQISYSFKVITNQDLDDLKEIIDDVVLEKQDVFDNPDQHNNLPKKYQEMFNIIIEKWRKKMHIEGQGAYYTNILKNIMRYLCEDNTTDQRKLKSYDKLKENFENRDIGQIKGIGFFKTKEAEQLIKGLVEHWRTTTKEKMAHPQRKAATKRLYNQQRQAKNAQNVQNDDNEYEDENDDQNYNEALDDTAIVVPIPTVSPMRPMSSTQRFVPYTLPSSPARNTRSQAPVALNYQQQQQELEAVQLILNVAAVDFSLIDNYINSLQSVLNDPGIMSIELAALFNSIIVELQAFKAKKEQTLRSLGLRS